jgi:hypothetical protein
LAVVLPPADRTQCQRSRRFQRLRSAAGTTKASFLSLSHDCLDAEAAAIVYLFFDC